MALSIDSASSGTWIDTLLVDASLVRWALTVQDALRSTRYEWITKEPRLAGADSPIAS